MNLSTVEVGYFSRCTRTKGGTNIPLLRLLEDIRGGRWRKEVDALRSLPRDSPAYSKAKKRLPCILLSATTRNGLRGAAGIGEHTGIVQADVDKLGRDAAVELRDKLATDPHILATWLSPGGEGVKAAVCVDASKEMHLQSFEAVEGHFNHVYRVGIDGQCKDITRLCFVSYDPDLQINGEAVPLPVVGRSNLKGVGEVACPTLSSTVLQPKDYNLHLHNSPSTLSADWTDYPLLEPLYKRLVLARLGEPHRGTRNQAVVEIASSLFASMTKDMMLVCLQEYCRQFERVFADYPIATAFSEAENVWKGCEGNYPAKWLSTAERAAYATLEDESKRVAFRICQSLSCCTTDESVPPPQFFISAEQLGARLGILSMSAWRILADFEKKSFITKFVKGQKRTAGVRARATIYKWSLTPIGEDLARSLW